MKKLKRQPNGGSSTCKRRKNKIPFRAKRFKALMNTLSVVLSVLKVILKVFGIFMK